MAMLGLKVPADVGRLLSSLHVQGERIPSDQMHVTLLDLENNVPVDQLLTATKVALQTLKGQPPFTVKIEKVGHFDKGRSGYPIICPVVSQPLTDLRDRLWGAFEAGGVDFSKKWPDFKGHVTLAYLKDGEPKDRDISPVEWGVTALTLWGGDDGENRLVTTLPLGLKQASESVLYRTAVRLAASLR